MQNEFEHKMSSIAEHRHQIVVSFVGCLTQEIISQLEAEVEEKVTALEIAKGPLKKTFFICVETLQNMLIHGHKTENAECPVFFALVKTNDSLIILSANLVANTATETLQKQIDSINAFEDEKALKAYYLMRLENNQLSEKGGAGLGFITIGMKSGNKLHIDFKKINDSTSLFILKTTIGLA